jgi:hypothetical protein
MAEPLCVTHLVDFFKHKRLSCALMSSASTTIGVNTPNTNNIKGAFTLGVSGSSVESGHTMLTI